MAEALEQAQQEKELRDFKKALEEAETNYRDSERTTDEEE